MITTILLENKGLLLMELKQFKQSELAFQKVINILTELIEAKHSNIAEAFNYLTLSLRYQEKLDIAIIIHNKVLTIMSNVIANNSGQILELTRRSAVYRARTYETNDLLHIKKNKIEETESNFRIAIKIFDRTLG